MLSNEKHFRLTTCNDSRSKRCETNLTLEQPNADADFNWIGPNFM